jgi:hypothetical protein
MSDRYGGQPEGYCDTHHGYNPRKLGAGGGGAIREIVARICLKFDGIRNNRALKSERNRNRYFKETVTETKEQRLLIRM